jgi:DNA modification methylase
MAPSRVEERILMRIYPDLTDKQRTLIMGENLAVMEKLAELGYKGRFNMIYFDGPFNSGLLFSAENHHLGMEYIHPWDEWQSIREYTDLNLYLNNYRQRIERARELLSDEGIFVLHTNQLAGHYVKVLLDEVFGKEHFRCEAIWKHSEIPWTLPERMPFGYQHETLFFYSKSDRFFRKKDGIYPSVWDDIGGYEQLDQEGTGFPSQKPLNLLQRVLEMTTEEGHLVGDFYCGSGSFVVAAEKMNRRWIACDRNHQSMEVTRARFSKMGISLDVHVLLDEYQPWLLQNEAYTKRSFIPVSLSELKELAESVSHPNIVVRAYEFLPDVDMLNPENRFVFQYLVPDVSPAGISGNRETCLMRPTPKRVGDEITLEVPDPFKWVLHHVVHVQRNEYRMMQADGGCPRWVDWSDLENRVRDLLARINNNWIRDIVERDDSYLITDIFGYQYQLPLRNE